MTTRLAACIIAIAGLVAFGSCAMANQMLEFVYLSRYGDDAYIERKAYTGLKLRELNRPLAGARAGIKESRVPGRAAGLAFELVEQELDTGTSASDAIKARLKEHANSVFLLDLPLADVIELAALFKDSDDALMFNIRHSADRLRMENCSAAIFHTYPSQSMLTDAAAQYLAAKNWKKVLVLASDSEADAAEADIFERSAQKFGLRLTGRRQFVSSNDPRERELNNARLLTYGMDYDIIFLLDSEGEFGRYLSYSSVLPRPVMGAEGLMASAWHWTWERNGAPQLNQRLRRVAERNPTALDWAAWVAVKAAVGAAIATGSVKPAKLREALTLGQLEIDMYKVGPGSFRTWDHQLRQPILLHTYNAVIATAPLEGFSHQFNNFDTLGFDEPEKRCNLR